MVRTEEGIRVIVPDGGTDDVSVHRGCIVAEGEASLWGQDAILEALEPGEKVEYDVVEAPCGRQATQVRRVEAWTPS